MFLLFPEAWESERGGRRASQRDQHVRQGDDRGGGQLLR
jgi:hypothetical protein